MNQANQKSLSGASFIWAAALACTLATSGCSKIWLDWQMEALCKADGGVKVYETVKLPPEMFDQYGDPFPGWRQRKPEDRLGAEYIYERTETILKDGDPIEGEGRLVRIVRRVLRDADLKLMGVSVTYARSGGDFIAYAHFTSKVCPADQKSTDLIHAIFIRREG